PRAGPARGRPQAPLVRRRGAGPRRRIRGDGVRPAPRRGRGPADGAVCRGAGGRDRRPLHHQPIQGRRARRSAGGPDRSGRRGARSGVPVRLHGRRAGAGLLRAPGLRARRARRGADEQVGGLRPATARDRGRIPPAPSGPGVRCGARLVSRWLRALGALILMTGLTTAGVAGGPPTPVTALPLAAPPSPPPPRPPPFPAPLPTAPP